MNRRSIIRLQLMLLALLAVGLLFMRYWRSGEGDAVSIEDIEPLQLRHASFAASMPTSVTVRAVGSLEFEGENAPMATAAWMMRRGDREVVWRLKPSSDDSGRGRVVEAEEEVQLARGKYDVYFASYGNNIHDTGRRNWFTRWFGTDRDWQKDSRRWTLSVSSVEGAPRLTRIGGDPEDFSGHEVLYRAAPMRNKDSKHFVFEVTEPTEVQLYAIGELSDDGRDYGWIDNLSQRRRVWELKPENTEHAGGHFSNRFFEGALQLEPGVYAANYETDAGHAYANWRANPPFDPRSWGLTLLADDGESAPIRPFDPREARAPLLELTRIGDDQHDKITFTVERPLDVVIQGLGEMSRDRRYDYGWIENAAGEHVWEMQYNTSVHAGGDGYNRSTMDIVHLPEGEYSAHFVTDDSHAFGDWPKDRPRQPDRWGMAVFPLEEDVPPTALSIIQRTTTAPDSREPGHAVRLPEMPELPPIPNLDSIEVLQKLRRNVMIVIDSVGNDANIREPLQLRRGGKIIVVAHGEMSPDERFDYAWIERADNGETVWSMDWQNTIPAGGDERNRLYAGPVDLPSGEYVVRYRSDPSHAFGDFGKIAPRKPDSWGVTILNLD